MNEVERRPDPPRGDATETLLKRARAGDAAAFEQLFALHGERLRRSARAKVPTALRARIDDSDVVQEALVDAVTHLDSFQERGEGSFRRWLSALLRNRLLMTIQSCLGRQKRDARRETHLKEHSGSKGRGVRVASPQSSPSAAAMRGERRLLLERAIATLPADHAQVLRLVRLEERSISEAAAAMGRTDNAVKKLLARALLSLREALDAGTA